MKKRFLALGLSLVLALSLAACGGTTADTTEDTTSTDDIEEPVVEEPAEEAVTARVAALKGPTAMGLSYLLDQFGVAEEAQSEPLTEETSANGGSYVFTLAASADEVTPLLIQGELDMACVPANLASVLYNKTEGQIVTLAVNTLGVLYIVENGNAVQSIQDLRGTTIVAAGKGSTPEYALRYLLSENGLDPDVDVTIDWKSEHSECVAALASGAATIALLPQPFVTVAQNKIDGLRVALDLTEEWDALDNGSALLTGVVVARKDFVETYPQATAAFLADYADSVAWVNGNTADAAAVIGEYGIVDTAVAEQALPYCNIVCITGSELQEKLSGYLQVLFDAEPTSVGGQLPGDDFYYGA